MSVTTASPIIRAAGCAVWRVSKKNNLKVLLIHRERYDDWSLPKGKLETGETFLEAAVREVHEEVNATGVIGPELGTVRYQVPSGRDKIVRFWSMKYVSGDFIENDEVDKARWVKADEAIDILSYSHEAEVVRSLIETLV